MFRKYILCRTPHVLPWPFFGFECTRSHKELESCRTNIWSKWLHAIHENLSHCINCMWVDDVLKVSLAGAHLQANKMHVSTAILAQEPMAPATRINGIATVCLQRKIMPLHKVVTSCSQCLTNVHAFMIWNTCRIASRTYPIKCKSNRDMDKWWTHFHMMQSQFFSRCARLPWLRICVRRVCVTNVVNTILPQHVRLKVMWVVLTTSPAHCTYAEQLECAAMFEFFLFWMFCTAGTLNAAYWMKSRMQMMFLGTTWTHDVKKHGWCGFCFFFKSCTCLSKSMTRSRWFNDIDSFAESSQLICTADQYPVAHMRHSTSPYVPPMSNRCCLDFQNPKQNLCRCCFF